MKLKEYFLMILRSLNPDQHRYMVRFHFVTLVKYFFILSLVCILVSSVILLPMITEYQERLSGELSNFENFQIDLDVTLDKPITLLEKPAIVVDFNKDNLTKEFILVNDKKVQYKEFILFGREEVVFSNYKSVKSDKSVKLYSKVLLFLLPAVLFWVLILNWAKYLVLMGIMSFFGWAFFISRNHDVSYRKSAKVAIFTATPMAIIDLALWPLKMFFVIPTLIYIVYFVIGIIMVSERKVKHRASKPVEAYKNPKEEEFWDELKGNNEEKD